MPILSSNTFFVKPKPKAQKRLRSINETLMLSRNMIEQNMEEKVSRWLLSALVVLLIVEFCRSAPIKLEFYSHLWT